MSRISHQLICFSYHKSGTSLLLHVMTKVAGRLGLSLANHYGLVESLDPALDLLLLPHSVLRGPLERPYRAIRLIRDPRDIWVSGYLYHLHCHEGWCRNTDLDPTAPIQWPMVDYSMAHWPEDWKRRYLERLGGKSYQQNLLDRSLADGLDFELAGYTGCSLTAMREWTLNGATALDVRLEDVMADFDGAMLRIFDHFCFTPDQCQAALAVARSEDIRRMDDAAMAERPQIQSRTISKWRDVLSPAQITRFEAAHGDLIQELGYELTGAAPAVINTTPDVDVWLSADGASIRPTWIKHGAYSFVVSSGRDQVRLESCAGAVLNDHAQRPGDRTRTGLQVSTIAIRSDAGDIVIAADDPGLTKGWHGAERAGSALWRWTDGSAELPWAGVSGPAVVTVQCITPVEHTINHRAGRR